MQLANLPELQMIFEYGLLIADKNAFAAAGVVGMNQALGLIYTVTNPDGTVTTDSGRYSRCSMVFWVPKSEK